MQLKDLISDIDYVQIEGSVDIKISNLAYDSRKVRDRGVFFCIKGFKVDGHVFAGKAEEAGAVAIVVEKVLPDINITQVVVKDARVAMAKMASAFYDHPTRKLKLVGITGTNGKTTTSFMIENIFRTAGYKTGLVGTIEYRIANESIPVSRTTPESLDLQALFAKMVDAGIDVAVIEVSSHAIDLSRAEACDFDVTVFTNLSQDHLDYHKTIGEYFAVKKRLFDLTIDCSLAQVINVDDEYGRKLIGGGLARQIRYSTQDKVELYVEKIALRADGSDFKLSIVGNTLDISLKLPGLYNISNALAAAGVASALGISIEKIKEGLETISIIPGRFERVDGEQDFTVIVDYAHTPDSLEKVLTAARQLTEGKLITVFGCGGDRDKGKRPMMGKIAAELSDITVVTSDNPRSEEPMKIISQIISGVQAVRSAEYRIEEDRRLAIKMAVKEARAGDFVVIAGKGHENGQEIGDKKIPFDDVAITREILGEII